MRFPITRHRLPQLAADLAIIVAAWFLAFQLRLAPNIQSFYDHYFTVQVFVVLGAIKLSVFALFGFYNRWWRYVSTRDMWGAFRGVTAASLVAYVLFSLFERHPAAVPRLVWVLDWLVCLAFVAASRMLARTIIERPQGSSLVARGKEVIVVGAGDAAQLMLKEMLRTPALGYTPIGLIDDDPRKKNLRLHGIRVLGNAAELPHILRDRRPDELLIAIPSTSGEVRQRIVEVAHREGVAVKTLPGLHELIAGDLNLAGQIRPVEVEDVLGREPVEVDLDAIASYLSGETVLVTGAGGSIGSELCRQISRIGPARLVLVDHSEPALFDIERELVDERGFSAALPVLADVKNRVKLRQVFETYRPAVVFHAAAYKHVPLIESNPVEAVRNNTLATRTLAEIAVEFGAQRFVLISTDKAVNAKTVMGQSKAVCEWIVESFGARDDVQTRFVAVRFGNVLGSSGSVIPIFRRQIAKGGPVTVTHAEMTRYFMTIPEAVQLVVQAGAIGGRGRVFVLDMGEPVRILDLAHQMIRLSGREPERDVAIEIVGARPGEKLQEELWSASEDVTPSSHPTILQVSGHSIDPAWLESELTALEGLVEEGSTLDLVGRLAAMVREPRRVGPRLPEADTVSTAPASERTS